MPRLPTTGMVTNLQSRAEGSEGPSTPIIVGSVCGALGVLIAFLFLLRAIIRARIFRPRATPLPPVQELAHHRASERTVTARTKASENDWPEPKSSGRPRPLPKSYSGGSGTNDSVASLVRAEMMTPAAWEDSSILTKENSDASLPPLPLPQLPFLERHVRNSVSSETSAVSAPAISPSPSASSFSPAPLSSVSSSTTSLALASRSRSRPPQPGSSRAHSTNSSISRGTGRSRGTPHSRRSTMQIILPAPLAPQLSNWSNAASSNGCNSSSPDKSNRRFSSLSEAPSGAVDSWVSNPGRSISRERVDSGSSSRQRSRTPMTRRSKAASITVASPFHLRSTSSPDTGSSMPAPPETSPELPLKVPTPQPVAVPKASTPMAQSSLLPPIPMDSIPSVRLSFTSVDASPAGQQEDPNTLADDSADTVRPISIISASMIPVIS